MSGWRVCQSVTLWNASPARMKQLDAKGLLQGLDMAAQGRLTDIHDPGCGRESAVFDNAVEGAKLRVEHGCLLFEVFI